MLSPWSPPALLVFFLLISLIKGLKYKNCRHASQCLKQASTRPDRGSQRLHQLDGLGSCAVWIRTTGLAVSCSQYCQDLCSKIYGAVLFPTFATRSSCYSNIYDEYYSCVIWILVIRSNVRCITAKVVVITSNCRWSQFQLGLGAIPSDRGLGPRRSTGRHFLLFLSRYFGTGRGAPAIRLPRRGRRCRTAVLMLTPAAAAARTYDVPCAVCC